MANILTGNPYVIDSKGIICSRHVLIDALVYVPAAAGNAIVLSSWDEAKPILHVLNGAGTISGTNLLTTTDLITAGATGDVVRIIASNGAAANIGRRQIEAIGSNDTITIEEDNWTNESTKTYTLEIYDPKLCTQLQAGATDASPVVFIPKHRLRVPNLLVTSITAGTAYLYFSEGAYSCNT